MPGDSHALPLLCVTNRSLCAGDFLAQLQRVVSLRPAGILLREKDLDAAAYAQLAREVAALCAAAAVPMVVHTHIDVARELGCSHVHMTLPTLEAMPAETREAVSREFELSTSCHSVDDAVRAAEFGCRRIIAGHVYETDCKPGLEPRGLAFLRAVCAAVDIPVWAIGGITCDRLPEVRSAGAAGACMMSAFMHA
ncbi:MAG: thiamine phosphate synthase [Coriobacteriia bacterium]|nr:thiamine phosphate synthase [Coriobacteriia bacterium]